MSKARRELVRPPLSKDDIREKIVANVTMILGAVVLLAFIETGEGLKEMDTVRHIADALVISFAAWRVIRISNLSSMLKK